MSACAKWRLIDTGPGAPAWNMAVDEALFFLSKRPALRLYAWNPPALSLGYFQKIDDFAPEPARTLGVEIVRRSTGGGAILHEDELTYSVAARMGDMPFARRSIAPQSLSPAKAGGTLWNLDFYRTFHAVIISALGTLGVDAAERGDRVLASDEGPEEYCFAKSAAMDVVTGGRKIAGSAQRRRGDRLLMHGSIFLGPNRLGPMSASAAEFAGGNVSFEEFAVLFSESAREVLGISFEEEDLTAEEKEYAKKIGAEKYGADWWTKKR